MALGARRHDVMLEAIRNAHVASKKKAAAQPEATEIDGADDE